MAQVVCSFCNQSSIGTPLVKLPVVFLDLHAINADGRNIYTVRQYNSRSSKSPDAPVIRNFALRLNQVLVLLSVLFSILLMIAIMFFIVSCVFVPSLTLA